MISIARQLARRLWSRALPVRQAVAGRIDHYLDRHVQLWFDRNEHARSEQQRATEEVTLVVDALIRELARLQSQIHALEQAIAEREAAAAHSPRRHAA